MRSHARGLNPLARGTLISPDAKILLRQRCAPLRSNRNGSVPWPLTSAEGSQPNASGPTSNRYRGTIRDVEQFHTENVPRNDAKKFPGLHTLSCVAASPTEKATLVMKLYIPPWAVATVGSLLVIFSTAIGTLLLQSNDDQMQRTRILISDLETELQRRWDSHTLAEQRLSTAELFAGLIVQDQQNGIARFIIPRASKNIVDAIITMRLSHSDLPQPSREASGIVQPDCTDMQPDPHLEANIGQLSQRLEGGDLNAYDKLISLLDSERLLSACVVNSTRRQIIALENDQLAISAYSEFLRGLQISLNLIGLTIVLLKDLPIWRTNRNGPDNA